MLIGRLALMAIFCFVCIITAGASLPTDVDENQIGITLNQLPASQLGWGGMAAFPLDFVNGYFATLAQSNGDVIRGRYHAEVTRDWGLEWTLYTDGTFKGNSLSELGRQADLGVTTSGTLSFLADADIAIGIFGRSGGVFAKPNAFDTLSGMGYDENALEGYTNEDGGDLAGLNPAATGLSFRNRNSINVIGQFAYVHSSGIGIVAKFMPELVGSSDNVEDDEPVDQLIVSLTGSYELSDAINAQWGVDFGYQRFRDSKIVEDERSALVTISYSF